MDKAIWHKINTRTKPLGSLGKLEKIAFQIASVQQTLTPKLHKPAILVFAADHGITNEGVSPCPKEITHQMVMNFVNGGAGINVFSRQHGIELKVIDGGVDYDFAEDLPIVHRKIQRGTANMLLQPAMSVDTCLKAMSVGREMVRKEFEEGCNIIGFGEMGIGNTSAASLLLHKFSGYPLSECVGRGAGLDEKGVEHKLNILSKVASKYDPKAPLEVLATFGGLEIAMMCGAILEAWKLNMLILADGFIATSAFISAYEMQPGILKNTIFSHSSNEKGHILMLKYLKADPLLQLDLRLGEGTGVALAYPIIQSAVTFLNEMADFDSAQVFQVDK